MNVRRVVGAGLIASVVMGMIEMMYEAMAGAGFWSPVVFIGATVVRGLQSIQAPVPFDPVGVVVGLMGHMMNSVIFALIFTALCSRIAASRGGLVGWGVAFGLVVFGVMWYVVVPLVDPVMLKLNAPVFAVSHAMWGAALGWLAPQPSGVSVGLQGT